MSGQFLIQIDLTTMEIETIDCKSCGVLACVHYINHENEICSIIMLRRFAVCPSIFQNTENEKADREMKTNANGPLQREEGEVENKRAIMIMVSLSASHASQSPGVKCVSENDRDKLKK